jgi:predicted transcriptional regulator
MGKRDKLKVYRDILKACERGERKTRIMYRSNLTTRMLNGYLGKLEEAGLVRIEEGSRIYRLTEEGKFFLKILEKFCP